MKPKIVVNRYDVDGDLHRLIALACAFMCLGHPCLIKTIADPPFFLPGELTTLSEIILRRHISRHRFSFTAEGLPGSRMLTF
ncbi:hypothetical protein ECG_03386 [Echinococcus granulosus]|nr:hypothetical protein ECG_03386 [Echinococcus granulosus]